MRTGGPQAGGDGTTLKAVDDVRLCHAAADSPTTQDPPITLVHQGRNPELLDHLAHWLSDESSDKLKAPLDTSDWTREFPGKGFVPQQLNGVDCGVFTIM